MRVFNINQARRFSPLPIQQKVEAMTHCWQNQKVIRKESNGFSVLELVAVIGVLSVLASISVPRIGNIIESSQIDEAKALLNTAAADCLQKNRLNDENKDDIDETIVSDLRLSSIGFKIDKDNDANKCSYFQIIPINAGAKLRCNWIFSIRGFLSKFATPTSTDQASISSCQRWAGVNCKQDESLKNLIRWKKDIATSKAICEEITQNG